MLFSNRIRNTILKAKKDDMQIFVTQFFPTITADAPLGKVKNREGRAESQWAWKSPLLFI